MHRKFVFSNVRLLVALTFLSFHHLHQVGVVLDEGPQLLVLLLDNIRILEMVDQLSCALNSSVAHLADFL